MVSTRHHPRQFPEPSSPTPRSTRGTPSKASTSPRESPPASPASPTRLTSLTNAASNALQTVTDTVNHAVSDATKAATDATQAVASSSPAQSGLTRSKRGRPKSTRSLASGSYKHVVDPIIVVWLYFSLPLVVWDTGYVMFRPLTMPGGSLHLPIYKLYGVYGTVDYMYGWPAWNDGVGFTAAQGSLNVLETIMYGWYVYVMASRGQGTGWYKFWQKELWTQTKVVQGEGVALATLVCFSSAVMTLSKTILYCKSTHSDSEITLTELCRAQRVFLQFREHWTQLFW